jgi:multidrug efflux system membrane fusion protein
MSLMVVSVLVLASLVGGFYVWRAKNPTTDGGATPPGAGSGAANGGAANGPGGGPPGAGRRFGAGNNAQPVSVQAAKVQDIRVTVSAIGSIAAANTAVVHAQVSGVLQSLGFQEGQQVRAGQVLASIDPRAFQAALGQVQGALVRDQAQLENARVDLKRYKDLVAKDAVPQQQLDTQVALVRQLEGTVRVDQAAVDSAQLQLSYTRVEAPISGRVGLKQVDIGNVVQPGDANGIVSIAQTRPAALVFAVPSDQVPKIMDGLRTKRALLVEAMDRSTGKPLAVGRVASLDNAIDATTDTIKVKALFPNSDDALFPNQSVSVRLQIDTLKDAMTVPQAAVLRGSQGFYVYVASADGTVSTKPIKPGVVDKDWMAIEGDVKAGDKVVIDGVDRLRNGAKVEVIDTSSRGKQRGGQGADAAGRQGGEAGKPAAAKLEAAKSQAPTAAAKADATAQQAADPGAERHKWADNLSEADKEKIKNMTPEERHAWFQKMRSQRSGGANAAPGGSN